MRQLTHNALHDEGPLRIHSGASICRTGQPTTSSYILMTRKPGTASKPAS